MQGSAAASVGGDVFLTGASGLMMQGASLGKVLSLGFGEGFLGGAAAQRLLNEDGEINWALAIGDGMFQAVMAGLVWRYSGNGEKRIVRMRNIFNLIELQYLRDNSYRFIDEGGIWHAVR